MTDPVLRRYIGGAPGSDERDANEAGEGADDYVAFGWRRGALERAVMLTLLRKDGSALAVAYSTLDEVEFDPSHGFTLRTALRTIAIKGRNLNAEVRESVRLLDGITTHRVSWIKEASESDSMLAHPSSPVVERIEW